MSKRDYIVINCSSSCSTYAKQHQTDNDYDNDDGEWTQRDRWRMRGGQRFDGRQRRGRSVRGEISDGHGHRHLRVQKKRPVKRR